MALDRADVEEALVRLEPHLVGALASFIDKFFRGPGFRLIVEMEEDALGIVGLLDESLTRQRGADEARAAEGPA